MFLVDFENSVATTFQGLVATYSGAITSAFTPVFYMGFSIYTLFIAYEVGWGKSEDGMQYYLTKMFKIFIIGTLALKGWPMAYQFMLGMQEAFVGAVGGAVPSGSALLAPILENNITKPLMALADNIVSGIIASIKDAFPNPLAVLGNLIMGVLAFIGFGALFLIAIFLCVVAMGLYGMSLASFYVILALGPFFVMCAAFPISQRFFENWVGALMSAVLAMVFVVIITTTAAAMLNLGTDAGLVAAFPATGIDLENFGVVKVLLNKAAFVFLILYLYRKAFDLAAGLAGGMNMGGGMSGFVRSLARANSQSNKSSASASQPNSVSSLQGGGEGGSSSNVARLKNAATTSLTNGALRVGGGVARIASDASSVGSFAYNRGASALRQYANN